MRAPEPLLDSGATFAPHSCRFLGVISHFQSHSLLYREKSAQAVVVDNQTTRPIFSKAQRALIYNLYRCKEIFSV